MKLFLFLSMSALLAGCYTDSSSGKCDGKRDHEIKDLCKRIKETGYVQENFWPDRDYPSFNPKNGNELVFTERYNLEGETSLCHYDRNTAEKRIIREKVYHAAQPGYGPHGWIAMPGDISEKGIFFININTDSVFHWNTGQHFQSVYWNPAGDKLCVFGEAILSIPNLVVTWPELTTDTFYHFESKAVWKDNDNFFLHSHLTQLG